MGGRGVPCVLVCLRNMNSSEETDDQVQISYEQFQEDCEKIVKLSDEIGDRWRLCNKNQIIWIEYNCHQVLFDKDGDDSLECDGVQKQDGDDKDEANITSSTIQSIYEVHYSLSYGVPVLYCRFSSNSGELLDYDIVRTKVLGHDVTNDMVSHAPHPLSGLPWLQVHPCRTAITTKNIRDTKSESGWRTENVQCNYVTTFISLYGQAVGLNLSPRYAT